MKKGDKVRISANNDNDNYDDFRNETLIITHAEVGGKYYDMAVYPQKLIELKRINGDEIDFAIYEYELELI